MPKYVEIYKSSNENSITKAIVIDFWSNQVLHRANTFDDAKNWCKYFGYEEHYCVNA